MTTLNLIVQIDPSQHESEPRTIQFSLDDESKAVSKIVNYSSLSTSEKATYNAFIALINSK